jgi:type I restriction enzyme S subunit
MDGDFRMCKWADGDAYLNQRVVRFRPKRELSPYYLFLALEKPIHLFDSTIIGTTVAHLGDRDLKTIDLVIPSADVLNFATEKLNPIYDQELNLRKRNKILRRTRDLLLPRLISGDLDVSHLDIRIAED